MIALHYYGEESEVVVLAVLPIGKVVLHYCDVENEVVALALPPIEVVGLNYCDVENEVSVWLLFTMRSWYNTTMAWGARWWFWLLF